MAARDDAHRARLLSRIWWSQAPIVCGGYLYVSNEGWPEKLIAGYIAFASIAAMGATYAGKEKAALAEHEASG